MSIIENKVHNFWCWQSLHYLRKPDINVSLIAKMRKKFHNVAILMTLLFCALQGANSGLDSMETSATNMDWEMLKARYEADVERRKVLGLSWADIDEAESRTPGRGAHMHEKLSSPSRKRYTLIYYSSWTDEKRNIIVLFMLILIFSATRKKPSLISGIWNIVLPWIMLL